MAEAAYRQDYSWIKYARHRMMQLFLPCAVIVVCAFSLLGPWFTAWWLKTSGGLNRMHLTAYGVLFVLTAWSHMHYVMLGSLGMARAAAKVLMAEAVLILFLTWWGIQWNGLAGAIIAASAGMAAVSAWAMPLLLGRALRRRTGPENETAPVMVPA
jgi:O-antigen/teichoic acid export membrane protein